jgi:tetratricopeptide (TPR) repeat protein
MTCLIGPGCEGGKSEAAPSGRSPASSGDLIADRRYAWAQDLESKGDLAGAAELLAQSLELTPGYASAWFALGELREKLGDTDGAAAAYRKALVIDPDLVPAVVNLAGEGIAEGRLGIEPYDKALVQPSSIGSSGLQTKCARTRCTRPRVRTCTRSAVPVHHGLPIRHARIRRASSVPRSGRSSDSASAWCQALQPFDPRTRKSSRPEPCQ